MCWAAARHSPGETRRAGRAATFRAGFGAVIAPSRTDAQSHCAKARLAPIIADEIGDRMGAKRGRCYITTTRKSVTKQATSSVSVWPMNVG